MKNKSTKKSKKIAVISALAFVAIIFCSILTLCAFNFFLYEPANLDWLTQTPIAHRGLHEGGFPENSLGAFSHAINMGYIIEFDVQLTKDDVPVVFHDKNTLRMTGQNNLISETNFEQLSSLRLNETDENIPTLQQALELINGQIGVLIEIKAEKNQNLNAILALLQDYEGTYALQFFNAFTCSWFSSRLPEISVGMIYGDVNNISLTPLLNLRDNLYNMIAKPNFISYNYNNIKQMNLNKHREKGLVILGYTFTQSELSDSEYSAYFDNIIFDPS